MWISTSGWDKHSNKPLVMVDPLNNKVGDRRYMVGKHECWEWLFSEVCFARLTPLVAVATNPLFAHALILPER